MKSQKPWSRLLSGLLCLVMLCSLVVPTAMAEQTEPVSLTGNAKVSAYTIADPANYYNNNSSFGYIAEVEEASYDRLLDGKTADQYPEKFDDKWVDSAWNDPNGGRYLFLNLYRGVSRDITIDLGDVHNITELNLHVGISAAYGVPGPTNVKFYLSENGTEFYLAGTVNSDDVTTTSVDIPNLEHGGYILSDLNYNARYVRIQFPVSVWVCFDEVVVAGTAHEHSYTDVTVDSTCTEGGYTTHTCTECGYSYVDAETEALGHDYQAEVTPPTDTEQGYTTYTCTRCGHTYVDDYTDPVPTDPTPSNPEPTDPVDPGFNNNFLERLKDWLDDLFRPSKPGKPTEPTKPTEPGEIKPPKPSKPNWGDWFKWFWPFR